MRLYASKKEKPWRTAAGILLFTGLFAAAVLGIRSGTQYSGDEELNAAREALRRAVVNCYAIEGEYPESADYLMQHYGVYIDEDKYVVDYEIFAPNIMPTVDVVKKGY